MVAFCVVSTAAKADGSFAEFFSAPWQTPTTITHYSHQRGYEAQEAAIRSFEGGAHASVTRASWYGGGERLSRRTASGEVFRPDALTAAHRSLPLGTRLLVSANGRTVMVRVNDRGPAKYTGRSLDLSRGAARALGILRSGTAVVSYRVVGL